MNCELTERSLLYIITKLLAKRMELAALAHLGERQTEVHFESPYHCIRFLEVLCSIHRSGISYQSFCIFFALLAVV